MAARPWSQSKTARRCFPCPSGNHHVKDHRPVRLPGRVRAVSPGVSARSGTPVMTILVVDIGGTSLKFGFSVEGRPHDDIRLFPSTRLCQGDCIDTLAALTREVIEGAGLAPDLIVSTVPGFIDRD